MTGWRLGYLIVPAELAPVLQKMHQNFFISANASVRRAGIAALREAGDDATRMRTENARRRLTLLEGLRGLGLTAARPPTDTFCMLANARHVCADSPQLAFDVLRRAQVAVTPGIDFGSNAQGYLRFSHTTSIERIGEGLARLKGYLGEAAAN